MWLEKCDALQNSITKHYLTWNPFLNKYRKKFFLNIHYNCATADATNISMNVKKDSQKLQFQLEYAVEDNTIIDVCDI